MYRYIISGIPYLLNKTPNVNVLLASYVFSVVRCTTPSSLCSVGRCWAVAVSRPAGVLQLAAAAPPPSQARPGLSGGAAAGAPQSAPAGRAAEENQAVHTAAAARVDMQGLKLPVKGLPPDEGASVKSLVGGRSCHVPCKALI